MSAPRHCVKRRLIENVPANRSNPIINTGKLNVRGAGDARQSRRASKRGPYYHLGLTGPHYQRIGDKEK